MWAGFSHNVFEHWNQNLCCHLSICSLSHSSPTCKLIWRSSRGGGVAIVIKGFKRSEIFRRRSYNCLTSKSTQHILREPWHFKIGYVGGFAVTVFPICIKDDRDEGRKRSSNCTELKVPEENKDSYLLSPIVGWHLLCEAALAQGLCSLYFPCWACYSWLLSAPLPQQSVL